MLIPYCEFHRVDAGRIAESAFFCDIVSVMKQAGLNPLPMQTGAEIVNVFNGHVLEHAEGCYGGWFGWPNLRMNQGDGFMGLPASERTTEMRVVDINRREGDKLAENWVFIDLLPTCGCWGWMCWRGAPGFVDRNAASGPGSSRVSTTGRGSTTRMRRFPSSPWRTSRERRVLVEARVPETADLRWWPLRSGAVVEAVGPASWWPLEKLG